MLQDSIIVRQRHEKFIATVCNTEVVWVIENDNGFATSTSNETVDDESEPVGMICFWSDNVLAKSCIQGEWAEYVPVEIPLSDFIENWCIGMSNDGLLVGTNFDRNMFGFETDPLNLIIELGKELKNQNKEISLGKYHHLGDLIHEVEEITKQK